MQSRELDKNAPVWVTDDSEPEEAALALDRQATWTIEDPVEELVQTLFSLGRNEEAEAIQALLALSGDEMDELMMRSLISHKWSEDWNSPEDASYDD